MRYLRYLALLAAFGFVFAPANRANAQVSVGVGIGDYPVAPPVCAYGYYPYAPYACAPYGYYGPDWFSGGVFIGAGPWYHRGFYGRGFYGYRGGYRRPVGFHGGFVPRGGRVAVRGFSGGRAVGRGGFHGGRR
jgi:hypothetical protein